MFICLNIDNHRTRQFMCRTSQVNTWCDIIFHCHCSLFLLSQAIKGIVVKDGMVIQLSIISTFKNDVFCISVFHTACRRYSFGLPNVLALLKFI